MKKFVSIVLTLVLVLGITIPASASQITIGTIETEEQKLARVQAEVLSGNITNEQDVIEVALAQYAEKVAYCRANGIEMDPNESLSITQVIESDASVAGTDPIEELAITGLLLLDESGNQITADSTNVSGSQTNRLDGATVAATLTMTISRRIVDSAQSQRKLTQLKTVIFNATGYDLIYLQQFGYYSSLDEYIEYRSPVIAYPSQNQSYTFSPNDPWRNVDGMGYYEGNALIKVDTQTFEVLIGYNGLQNYFFGP